MHIEPWEASASLCAFYPKIQSTSNVILETPGSLTLEACAQCPVYPIGA